MSDIISIYSPELWDNKKSAAQIGGENRVNTARRDKWGRLQPKDHDLPAPVHHGKAGGKAILAKYGREYFRKLAQKRRLKPMNTNDRIEELEEMKQEYILNETVTEDDHPSWGEIAEAQAIAEAKWDETEEGKELKALLGD